MVNGSFTLNFIEKLPGLPGSYALMALVENPVIIKYGPFEGKVVQSGHYVYAGSAFGPGGLKARLGRHLGSQQKVFWHIDYIKSFWQVDEIWLLVGGSSRECTLVAAFGQIPGIEFPLAGFGASDCRNGCKAHLALLPEGLSLQAAFNHIQSFFSSIRRLIVA